MINTLNFAIMFDPNENIADFAVSCVQSSLIPLFVLIAGVLLGSNLFFFRKNKKVFSAIIIGFLVLFGLIVSLGSFFSNSASAQLYESGATFAPYYGYEYSCPSIWETLVESWPKYLIQTVLLSLVVFFILFIISLVIRHFRKNKIPAKIENAFPRVDNDNSTPQQPSEENTIDNVPENPGIKDIPNPPEDSDSTPTDKNTI